MQQPGLIMFIAKFPGWLQKPIGKIGSRMILFLTSMWSSNHLGQTVLCLVLTGRFASWRLLMNKCLALSENIFLHSLKQNNRCFLDRMQLNFITYKRGVSKVVIAREERPKPAYRQAGNLFIIKNEFLDCFTAFAMTTLR